MLWTKAAPYGIIVSGSEVDALMESILIGIFGDAFKKVTIISMIQIGLVVVGVIAVCIALSITHKQLKAKLPLGDDVRKGHIYTTVFRLIRVAVILMGIIVILQLLGFNTSGIAMAFGVFAVLFILAVKDTFQDIFSGITIMADKYFSVGDAVEFEGKEGVVISFTVRTTKIECLDDRSVLSVSNRNISKIRKLTHLVDIDLPLSYDEEPKRVYKVLGGICEKISKLEGVEDCQFKGTQNFADSAIIYKIRFFCEPYNRPDIRRSVIKTIQDGLDDAGISIPYQQIDIHQ